MKALSLTQPWADVILEQGKRVENRTKWTACRYRGPILLHAAQGMGSRANVRETLRQVAAAGVSNDWISKRFRSCADRSGAVYFAPLPSLHLGGIVGRAEIVDVIAPELGGFDDWVRGPKTMLTDIEMARREAQRRWWFGGFALVLDKVEPLPFVPCKGALGLFNLPDDFARTA